MMKSIARARPTSDAVGWLGLAASPSFALMAWLVTKDASRTITICSSAPGAAGMSPIGGMALMYLLMSFFHLSPWLKLAFGRPQQLPNPLTQSERD